MSDLPEPDFKPEDVDELIRDYGMPLDASRKASLMDKLRGAQHENDQPGKTVEKEDRDADEHDR